MNDCIFCKIISKEVSSKIIAENDEIMIFEDHQPSAPIHWLIVPKKHSVTPYDTDQATLGLMIKIAADSAEKNGIDKKGYRLIINVGKEGGQIVQHIHLHLMAGKQLASRSYGRG